MPAPAPARFFSVPARISGRVVCRVSSTAGTVWAWRAPRAGQRPSPRCLFLPTHFQGTANALATCARSLGWRATIKPGNAFAVWRAGPLASNPPAWACKVILPPGLSAPAARAAFRDAWHRLTW